MVCMLVASYLVAVKRGYAAGTFPGWGPVLRAAVAAVPLTPLEGGLHVAATIP